LLDSVGVFPRDDAQSLSNLLISLANDPVEMARQSAQNLIRSREFEGERIRSKFMSFLEYTAAGVG
jgi:hypothetical protein